MIESLCLAVLFVVVALRARRSYRKAAWWGTVFGMVSVMTYGVIGAGPADLDRVLGDRNTLTLVRDLTALAAMWAFHNAVVRERGRLNRRLPWWSLLAAALSVAVPFSLIDRGGCDDGRGREDVPTGSPQCPRRNARRLRQATNNGVRRRRRIHAGRKDRQLRFVRVQEPDRPGKARQWRL